MTQLQSSELRPINSIVLAFGKHKRLFEIVETTSQTRKLKAIYLADGYNPYNYESDIAIIVLDSPVEFNFYVRPVCIPEHFNSLIEEVSLNFKKNAKTI